MTTTTPQTPAARPGARIYQFPLGGRASVGPRRAAGRPQPLRSDMRLAVTPTEAGSGWYHDAAIQDAWRRHDH